MEMFWQFFAVGVISLLVGVQIGRSTAISQLLMQQQQAAAQQMPQFLMPGMGSRPAPQQPTNSGVPHA